MRISTLRRTAIAAAVVALMGSFGTGVSAEPQRNGDRARAYTGGITQNVDRGRNVQNRNFSSRNFNRSNRNYTGQRRFYGNNGYGRNYGNRRYGNNGFGIYLNLSEGSGCKSYYRKWRNTGSRYWRNRYYDCVG